MLTSKSAGGCRNTEVAGLGQDDVVDPEAHFIVFVVVAHPVVEHHLKVWPKIQ